MFDMDRNEGVNYKMTIFMVTGDEAALLFLNTDTTYVVDVKYCPKCYLPINKNGGCPFMACRCGHQFCWLCLVPWASHGACVNAGKSDSHGTMVSTQEYTLPLTDWNS